MPLIAGIDIGTSSVKISLLDVHRRHIVATDRVKYDFKANQLSEEFPEYCQQNVSDIIDGLHKCLLNFDVNLRNQIKMISICGQMHGCVLWDSNRFFEYTDDSQRFRSTSAVSDLYNWQDNRCDHQFLASLPKPDSYADRISSGFGCATIFWLKANSSDTLKPFNSGGTIMDLIVAILCHLQKPVMSTQNAMSWGYFDPIDHNWNKTILSANAFPIQLLPTVQKPGTLAGTTKFVWLGIPENTPVMVAMGDMQCATYANIQNDTTKAVLSVSTSIQLSILMDNHFVPTRKSETRSEKQGIDCFPYYDDMYLSVAASLNGGNVLQALVKSIRNIIQTIADIDVSDDRIWRKIFDSYKTKTNYNNNNTNNNCDNNNKIIVKPTLLGERHDPSLKASIVNISHSIGLNELIEAFCEGLIDNVFQMMSIEYLKTLGAQQLVGTGSALINNPILRHVLEKRSTIPVVYKEDSDADVGAVWVALHYGLKSNLL